MASPELGLTPELVGKVCEESCERMQLAADLLLLKTGNSAGSKEPSRYSVLEPVSGAAESYGKLRDMITANSKFLVICIKEFDQKMHLLNLEGVNVLAEKLSRQAIELTEAAASAAYHCALTDIRCVPATPGVIDRYKLECAKQELHMSCNKFKPDYGVHLSSEFMLSTSKRIADSLATLAQSCTQASENTRLSPGDRAQFATCSQSLQGATAAFLTSLKAFASSRAEEDRKRCLLFGQSLLSTVDCIVEFSSYPQFAGQPAVLTKNGQESQIDILGGAMSIISASVQLLDTAKSILYERRYNKHRTHPHWQKLANCVKAGGDSCKLLSASIREHTPRPSRRSSTDFT